MQHFIIGHVPDLQGCGAYRWRNLKNYVNNVANIKYRFLEPPDALSLGSVLRYTDAVVFKHLPFDILEQLARHYYNLKKRNKYTYNIVIDFDDLNFRTGDGGANDFVKQEIIDYYEKIFKMSKYFDVVTVSTMFLKDAVEKKGMKNVRVVPNAVPRYLWGYPTHKLRKKPLICYPGSMSHYGDKGATPDFGEKWFNFVKAGVERDIFDFIVFGENSEVEKFFGKKLAKKIGHIRWAHTISYPSVMRAIDPDFIIGPLAPNDFNRAKSNIKLLEACAIGAVFFGDVFDDSPYECVSDAQAIKVDDTPKIMFSKFKHMCKNYAELQKAQGDFLSDSNLYTESEKYIGYYFANVCNDTEKSKE